MRKWLHNNAQYKIPMKFGKTHRCWKNPWVLTEKPSIITIELNIDLLEKAEEEEKEENPAVTKENTKSPTPQKVHKSAIRMIAQNFQENALYPTVFEPEP